MVLGACGSMRAVLCVMVLLGSCVLKCDGAGRIRFYAVWFYALCSVHVVLYATGLGSCGSMRVVLYVMFCAFYV